jgi:hypothetical protein
MKWSLITSKEVQMMLLTDMMHLAAEAGNAILLVSRALSGKAIAC